MISTSISQTFLSSVSIFHLHQPIVCWSHIPCGMPGLVPLINALFWERRDFHVSFSGMDMSGNVWNRPSGSSMVDMGISSNIMKPPLPNVTWHSGTYIQWRPPLIISFTKSWPCYQTLPYYSYDVITPFREASIQHLQRMRLANRGRLPLRTPGPVPFGICICSNVKTIHSLTCLVYKSFGFRTSLGTSILFGTQSKEY